MVVAAAGMNHHTGRLVDDQQLVVLVYHVERNLFGFYPVVVGSMVDHQTDDVARTDLVVALHGTLVDIEHAGIGHGLDAVTALMGHVLGEVFIHAQRHLPGVDFHAQAFEQFLFLYVVECFHHFQKERPSATANLIAQDR